MLMHCHTITTNTEKFNNKSTWEIDPHGLQED